MIWSICFISVSPPTNRCRFRGGPGSTIVSNYTITTFNYSPYYSVTRKQKKFRANYPKYRNSTRLARKFFIDNFLFVPHWKCSQTPIFCWADSCWKRKIDKFKKESSLNRKLYFLMHIPAVDVGGALVSWGGFL